MNDKATDEVVINRSCYYAPQGSISNTVLLFKPSISTFSLRYADKKIQPIERHDVDRSVRNVNLTQLCALLECGYLTIKKSGDHFSLYYQHRLQGGGPLSGAIAYWFTKTVCYGTATASVAGAVVVTGGAAGAIAGATIAAATSGATTGAAVVSGAIVGAGAAETAAVVTASTVVAAGGIAGTVAAIESASLTVGAIFTAIPFLP